MAGWGELVGGMGWWVVELVGGWLDGWVGWWMGRVGGWVGWAGGWAGWLAGGWAIPYV